MVETIRSVILVRSFTQNEFVAQVKVIRKNMMTLKGINPFCLVICPEADRYLSDEVMAEFIYTASQADKKFTVLNTSILSSRTTTPLINGVLSSNVKRVQKIQEEIAAPVAVVADGEVSCWPDFLTAVHATHSPNAVHSNGYHDYKRWIIKFARRGDAFSLRCLQQLIEEGVRVNPPLLGARRAVNLVLRVAIDGSPVFLHYSGCISSDNLDQILRSIPSGKVGTMIRDVNHRLDLSHVRMIVSAPAKGEEQPDNFDVSPIEFVKFELARKMTERMMLNIVAELAAIPHECAVCFEERPSERMMVLHGDTRHTICDICRKAIKICPFCRHDL
jgi:hypothetical protein